MECLNNRFPTTLPADLFDCMYVKINEILQHLYNESVTFRILMIKATFINGRLNRFPERVLYKIFCLFFFYLNALVKQGIFMFI